MGMPKDIFASRAPEDVIAALTKASFSGVRIERPEPITPWNVLVALPPSGLMARVVEKSGPGASLPLSRDPPTNGEDSSTLHYKGGAISENTYPGTSRMRTTKARDADCAGIGTNPALNGHARQAAARGPSFSRYHGRLRVGGRASNDDKWHRSDAATVAE